MNRKEQHILYKRIFEIAYVVKDSDLDTLVLGCTHYPLLKAMIRKYIPDHIQILEQGKIVAEKLVDYLDRHPEMDRRLTKTRTIEFQTTESAETFESKASLFMGEKVKARHIHF